MDLEREKRVRDAITYCMASFNKSQAVDRIVDFCKREAEILQEKSNSEKRLLLHQFQEFFNDNNKDQDVSIYNFHIDDFINSLYPPQKMYTEQHLQQAYNDGIEAAEQRCDNFDIKNYK